MKTLKIFLFLLAVTVSAAQAQFVKADLQVSGLTCSMCSKATEKSLRTLPFISDVKPDLNRNLFVITFKNNAPVSLDEMSKKVQSAGFAINQLTATVNFDQLKLNNNNSFNYGGNTFHIVNSNGKRPDGLVALTVVNKGFAAAATVKKYADALNSKTGTGKNYIVVI